MIFSSGASVILAYLNEKNRPYSAQDVFTNLQKQHGLGKTVRWSETHVAQPLRVFAFFVDTPWILWTLQAVVKAMELLALEGKIKEKIYGKQKIYFADQVQFDIWALIWCVGGYELKPL